MVAAEVGCKVCKCSSTAQKSCSAIFGSRRRLACESVFLGGGVAPRSADNDPECRRKASQTSLSPRLWGQLRVEQADDVTPRTEGAGLIIHAGLACQSRHQDAAE